MSTSALLEATPKSSKRKADEDTASQGPSKRSTLAPKQQHRRADLLTEQALEGVAFAEDCISTWIETKKPEFVRIHGQPRSALSSADVRVGDQVLQQHDETA